jgi:RNA polymerase sigma factor (sigma-70 family)
LHEKATVRSDPEELEALRDRRSPRWGAWRAFLRGAAVRRHRLAPEDADDVVQSALLKVFARLEAVREPSALLAYMLQALSNEVREKQRSLARHAAVPLDPPAPGARPVAQAVTDGRASPEDECHRAERRRLLAREIERACAARRHAGRDLRIALRVLLDDCGSGQVAKEMGLKTQTVYNVTHRVLKSLEDLHGEQT